MFIKIILLFTDFYFNISGIYFRFLAYCRKIYFIKNVFIALIVLCVFLVLNEYTAIETRLFYWIFCFSTDYYIFIFFYLSILGIYWYPARIIIYDIFSQEFSCPALLIYVIPEFSSYYIFFIFILLELLLVTWWCLAAILRCSWVNFQYKFTSFVSARYWDYFFDLITCVYRRVFRSAYEFVVYRFFLQAGYLFCRKVLMTLPVYCRSVAYAFWFFFTPNPQHQTQKFFLIHCRFLRYFYPAMYINRIRLFD